MADPLPLPLAPDVIVIHAALLTVVHAQPIGAVTLTAPDPSDAAADVAAGLML